MEFYEINIRTQVIIDTAYVVRKALKSNVVIFYVIIREENKYSSFLEISEKLFAFLNSKIITRNNKAVGVYVA